MITFHIYYTNSIGREIEDPVLIEAPDRDTAETIFCQRYPDLTASRIIDPNDLDDYESEIFLFI